MPLEQYERVLLKPLLIDEYHKAIAACLASTIPILFLSATFFSFSTLIPFVIILTITYSFITVAVLTQCECITIDTASKRYRISMRVLGFHFGQWKSLPSVTQVVVSPYLHRHSMPLSRRDLANAATTSLQAHERGYRVLLSVANSDVGIVAAWCREETALIRAQELSALFNVQVVHSSYEQILQS